MRILVWFKSDLRIRHNDVLATAAAMADEVIPFYCFDDHYYRQTELGFQKTGAFRAQFIRESVKDLGNSLNELGTKLVVRKGQTAREIQKIHDQLSIDAIYTGEEVTCEEIELLEKVEDIGIPLTTFWNNTLYHFDDLPFEIKDLPWVFTDFRKRLEKESKVREEKRGVGKFNGNWEIEEGAIPTMEELGLVRPEKDERAVLHFKGGEKESWKRVEDYVWQGDHLKEYKETRNGMIGPDFSSKLSPWLAQGCISPLSIFNEVKKYEQERISNQSTYWLIFELMWRDFFRFLVVKEKDHFFRMNRNYKPKLTKAFRKWQEGNTGSPFVNANMNEIRKTGYMSNRGRQNVASYLVNDLEQDWYPGAAWFESMLVDYDVCSNYGNWTYVAGVGHDPRKNRYFNVEKQAERYDPDGSYVKLWRS